jgi:hypothetical protein
MEAAACLAKKLRTLHTTMTGLGLFTDLALSFSIRVCLESRCCGKDTEITQQRLHTFANFRLIPASRARDLFYVLRLCQRNEASMAKSMQTTKGTRKLGVAVDFHAHRA